MATGPIYGQARRQPKVRAGIIAQLLREKRYIFVLDGFEVMQHQEGDRYGQISSREMLEFLGYLAGTEHDSFCLMTTRCVIPIRLRRKMD